MEQIDFYKSMLTRKKFNQSYIVVNRTQQELASSLVSAIQAEYPAQSVTVLDARTLTDKSALVAQLLALSGDCLLLDHLTEIPEGAHQEWIAETLRWCVKGDYRDSDKTTYPTAWEQHIAELKPKLIGTSSELSPAHSNHLRPYFTGMTMTFAYGANGYERL